MLPNGHIINIADDTQLYLSFDTNDTNELNNLHMCIADINNWMASNFLQLNSCRNLGIIFDNHLNFDQHRSLETVIHAFIASQFCNGLYSYLTQ